MSRRPQRAEAGFSLVELLVTIVLAGIVFAAMIPMFISAQTKNFADTMRLTSLSVAQDKIEKVRQLSYDSISLANLQSSSFADGQFGTTATISTGQAQRTITVSYSVTSYPAGSSGLTSQYKIVSVTATWKAPPGPVKPATLQTIVYRQYSGPPIADFSTDPLIDDQGVLGDTNLSTVTLKATIDMTAGLPPANAQFTISMYGGATIASQLVKTTDTNQLNGYWYDSSEHAFYWTWDASFAVNGTYDFAVVAKSSDGFAGPTPHLYPIISHVVPPAPPTNVVATAFDARADLTWSASGAGDLANYVVYRSASASGPWALLATVAKTTLSYSDLTAQNGQTYYYAVRALATTGKYSTYAVSNAASPINSTDNTPPTAPGGLAVVKLANAPTLRVTWTAATDPGTPSTGISKYEIYRSPNNVTWTILTTITLPVGSLTYDDPTVGYSASWYYKIRAFDGFSGVGFGPGPYCAAVLGGPTDPQPKHNLVISIKNGNNGPYNVWVLNANTGHYWTTANPAVDNGTNHPAAAVLPKNGSVTFYQLPDGPYTVYVNDGAFNAGTNKIYGATLSGGDGSLTGVVFP
jgi:prepilin-type N-terminal cleavage/methylation domain-containing protein